MTDLEPTADAGWFSEADRETVTAQSVPWLAAYFANAPTWSLDTHQAVGRLDGVIDDLARLVRLRVALAAMRQLEPLIDNILVRPSFAYTRRIEESVGALRGPLDVQRYIRRRGRPEAPRRYPVRVVHRRYDTDENILTAYAALDIDRHLAGAPLHLLPPDAPERREIERSRALITRWLQHRALSESIPQARYIRHRQHLGQLVDRAAQRVGSGRIAAPGRYLSLIEWVQSQVADAGGVAGEINWAFYDERFDTKLFEIWSLARLSSALEATLGEPTDRNTLLDRSRSAVRSWDFGGTSIHVHYQPSLTSLTPHGTAWHYTEPHPAPLTGFPDIAVVIQPVVGDPLVLLIDPKLRQRPSAPAEELYKLLGYYGNLNAQTPRGAIVFYSPGAARTYRLADTSDGHLLAIGVDPADTDATATCFSHIAALVTSTADIPPDVITDLQTATGDADDESVTAIRQRYVVQAMQAAAQDVAAGQLAPIEKATAASLGTHWDRIPDDARQMLVTAEYFGTHAPADADHSGPLLGLAAACETTLYALLIADAAAANPGRINDGATFGSMIYWLNDATYAHTRTTEGEYLREYLLNERPELDLDDVRSIVPALRELNVQYRIPAAHRHIVTQDLWAAGRSRVLDQHTGVIAQLTTTCAPATDD